MPRSRYQAIFVVMTRYFTPAHTRGVITIKALQVSQKQCCLIAGGIIKACQWNRILLNGSGLKYLHLFTYLTY